MDDDDDNDNNSHDDVSHNDIPIINSNNSINNNNNLFVPLNTVETLKRSISLYLQSGTVRTFIKLALFFVIPATAILLTVVYYVMHQINNNNQNNDDNDNNNDDNFTNLFWNYITILMSQSLLQTTLGAIAEGAIAVAVSELYLHRHPSWYICIQKSSTKALTLICSGFLVGISILFGYWCFYFPGLLLKINFMVVTPVIILEDEFYVLSALGRSWDLINNGHKFYVFKCLLGLDCLYWIINWILRMLLKEDDDDHPYFSLTFHILKMIPQTMIVPLFGILKTVIYINLLIEQEGTNQERFAQQIDHGFLSSSMVDGNGNNGISRVPLLFGENNNNNSNFNFNPNNNNNIRAGDNAGRDDVEISFDDPEASTNIVPEFQTLHDAFMDVARTRSASSSTVGGGGFCEESTHTSMESFMTAPTGTVTTTTTETTTTSSSSSSSQQKQQQQENDEV